MMSLGSKLTVRARVVFDNVPKDTISIKSLNLWFGYHPGVVDYASFRQATTFKVEFRDVPITQ
jgi:hypothetical protein